MSQTRAEIEAEIARNEVIIATLEASYLAAASNVEIEEYRMDSGDGAQKAIRRRPAEIREEIEAWKATNCRLQRQLDGTSNVIMKTVRYGAR